jgi:hypothetical protein
MKFFTELSSLIMSSFLYHQRDIYNRYIATMTITKLTDDDFEKDNHILLVENDEDKIEFIITIKEGSGRDCEETQRTGDGEPDDGFCNSESSSSSSSSNKDDKDEDEEIEGKTIVAHSGGNDRFCARLKTDISASNSGLRVRTRSCLTILERRRLDESKMVRLDLR